VSEQRGSISHPSKGRFDLGRAVWRSAGDDGRVQIAFVDDLVGMRDRQDPDGPVLVFTEAEWHAFTAGARAGEFDLPGD
jgi:hypothetical protein